MNLLNTLKPSLFVMAVAALTACNNSSEHQPEEQAQADNRLLTLYDFESPLDETFHSAAIDSERVDMDGNHVLKVTFNSEQNGYAGFTFRPETPWDWSEFDSFNIRMDLANDGDQSTQIYLNIKDGKGNYATRSVVVPVGGFKTYYAKLAGHDIEPVGDEDPTELNFSSGLRSIPRPGKVRIYRLFGCGA